MNFFVYIHTHTYLTHTQLPGGKKLDAMRWNYGWQAEGTQGRLFPPCIWGASFTCRPENTLGNV